MMKQTRILLLIPAILAFSKIVAQPSLQGFEFSDDSLLVREFIVDGKAIIPDGKSFPLLSFLQDGKLNFSNLLKPSGSKIRVEVLEYHAKAGLITARIKILNSSRDTVQLENLVPFGETADKVYITGRGNHELSRTHLFIPGKQPVNVIVPDNAWDLGFSCISLNDKWQIASLLRRDRASIKLGSRTRFETKLYPGGSVEYKFYAEVLEGNWHQALDLVFQERMLYDLDHFDNTLFERKDLQWVRHAYVNTIMMNWDKFYYDYTDKQFHINAFLQRGKKLYGGDDFLSLWPTWPTLGLDQRNQFDMFNDLPGGCTAIKTIANQCRQQGTKLFLCYNPWDESTRNENHFEGISKLIKATAADGMVLDTKGSSSKELQDAADKVRPGVIMYSEGMAVPKDMPGIVAGRVHNALYYPPMLNLNKLIKPEFAIFRVAELYKEPIQREFATAFFNGYGTELNIMAPGQPAWVHDQYLFLGRTSRILRENSFNFTSSGFTPLIETNADSIWVNQWQLPEKTVYTIYSIIPQGFSGPLFRVVPKSQTHFVDIWHHRLLNPIQKDNTNWVAVETNAFNKKYLGTNNEGEVDCIAQLPVLITAHRNGDVLSVNTPSNADELRIWPGQPAYDKNPIIVKPGNHALSINTLMGRYEGDIVIQLMDKGILMDETVLNIPAGEARRISIVQKTAPSNNSLPDMVAIPAGKFHFNASHGDEFIPYPKQDIDSNFEIPSYYMDKFPVTNKAFYQFMQATHYRPTDTARFLKHWVKGKYPVGQAEFPVVYISYEDAKAYAGWAGKRLPTEIEWQYAAQTTAGNEWPWVQTKPVNRKEQVVTETLTVYSLDGIDSSLCNTGNGKPYPVGNYPKGANPFGLQDLTGCVWQLTNDLYSSGSYRYIIIKGGSYFNASSSWWYVQGGPRELHYRQFLLRVSQGFERNATVGFRCLKDRK
jgi:formylglycine-generating enzyme required for sulfatase activity